MALIHITRENGKYIARGYGHSNASHSPISAYVGLKLMRMYRLGLIGSKYPFTRIEWIHIQAKNITNKLSMERKLMNQRFATPRVTF